MQKITGVTTLIPTNLVRNQLRIPCVLINKNTITHFHSPLLEVNRLLLHDAVNLKIDQNSQLKVTVNEVKYDNLGQPLHLTFFGG